MTWATSSRRPGLTPQHRGPLLAIALLPAVGALLLGGGNAGGHKQPIDEESSGWPSGLSLFPENGVPQPQWQGLAENSDWATANRRWRHGLRDRSEAWAANLDDVLADDKDGAGGDTILARNFSDIKQPFDGEFWTAVCNGTNRTIVRALKGQPANPLHGWNVKANTTCSDKDMLDGNFTDEEDAEMNCGHDCASVVDVGCERKEFRLCKLGSMDEVSQNGACLRMRVPDHRPPDSKPSKPMEKEFWKAFCNKAGAAFRLIFRDRLCSSGKALEGAWSEGACAELAAKDAACSQIFDFEAADPPVCRCLPTGTECNAPAEHVLVKHDRNVFIRVTVPAAIPSAE